MKNEVIREGSVRVDLLGGTIDLVPINVILPHVVTLNLATSLKAKVILKKREGDEVEFISSDYGTREVFKSSSFTEVNLRNNHFGKMAFMAQILWRLGVTKGLSIELSSGSPPGAGLGGSSAMGVTFYSALSEFLGKPLDRIQAIREVNGVEGLMLDCGPAGYQDYYPALFGGVLALIAHPGSVEVQQLYSKELKDFLESHLTLIYSGETRFSGMNNWEVYKAFFDRQGHVREGLSHIAELANQAYQAIQKKDFALLIDLIGQEGATRKTLFPKIVSESMNTLFEGLKKDLPHLGLKVCGAGGGGCFLLCHKPEDAVKVKAAAEKMGMSPLDFKVDAPL